LAEVIECIQRAVRLNQWTLGYMKVDHGGGYLSMAKQFFEGYDIEALFKQMCGIGMSQ
jgi:hypothetical protein